MVATKWCLKENNLGKIIEKALTKGVSIYHFFFAQGHFNMTESWIFCDYDYEYKVEEKKLKFTVECDVCISSEFFETFLIIINSEKIHSSFGKSQAFFCSRPKKVGKIFYVYFDVVEDAEKTRLSKLFKRALPI